MMKKFLRYVKEVFEYALYFLLILMAISGGIIAIVFASVVILTVCNHMVKFFGL